MPFDFSTFIEAFKAVLSKEHCSLRYLLCVSSSVAGLLLLRCVVQVGRLLDRLLFPRYTGQQVGAPIYIIANPRSGTTFLHRLLCLDDQFTYFKLYHTLLPSVTLIRLAGLLGKADRCFGRRLARLADRLSRLAFKGWSGIHQTLLTAAEEDEQLFLYTLLSPGLFMFFPFVRQLSRAAFVDRLPEKTRSKLMGYYRDCLQRQVYATGPGKTLLAKNVLIHGRLRSVIETLPDIRIVHLVRDPYEAIPSFISMYSASWRLLSPRLGCNRNAAEDMARLLCDYYTCFLQVRKDLPGGQLVELSYDDLVADPEGTVRLIYRKFGLAMSAKFERALRKEVQASLRYKSAHTYSLEDFDLSGELLRDSLAEFFRHYRFKAKP